MSPFQGLKIRFESYIHRASPCAKVYRPFRAKEIFNAGKKSIANFEITKP